MSTQQRQRSSFSLDTIMADSRSTMQQSKEASEQNTETRTTRVSDDEYGAILDALTGEKTASADIGLDNDQVRELLQAKVAELAGVSQSGMIKEAQIIGGAVYDGYLMRANEAEAHATKLAQVMELQDPDLEKIAEEIGHAEGVKLAMEIAAHEIAEGQKEAALHIEQIKVAAYSEGHRDSLEWLASFA